MARRADEIVSDSGSASRTRNNNVGRPPEQLPAPRLPPTPSDIENRDIRSEYSLNNDRSLLDRIQFWKSSDEAERKPLVDRYEDDGVSCKCTLSNFLLCAFGTAATAAGATYWALIEYINSQDMKDINETHIVGWGRAISITACTCGTCALCLTFIRTQCCKSKSP